MLALLLAATLGQSLVPSSPEGPVFPYAYDSPYVWAWFEFARDAGAGAPVLGLDYAVPLCDTLQAGEKSGNWWCLQGDGTMAAGSVTPTAIIKTTAPSVANVTQIPDGPSGRTKSSLFSGTSSGRVATAATSTPSSNITVCWLGLLQGGSAAVDMLVTHGTNRSAGSASWWLETSGTFVPTFFVTSGATTAVAATAPAGTPSALHLMCGTYDGAAVRAFLDGTVGTPSAMALPMDGYPTVKDTIHGFNGSVYNAISTNQLLGAFYTETVLSPARIAAIAHAVLADQPRGVTSDGDAGIAMTWTATTGVSCPLDTTGSALSILPTGRPCITMGGVHTAQAATNTLVRNSEFNNPAWTLSSSGAALPVVTADYAMAPDGTKTAERVQIPATAAGQFSFLFQSAYTVGVAHTGSAFAKGTSGSGTVYLERGAGGACMACVFTSSAWTRCLNVTSTTGNASWIVGADSATTGNTCGTNATGTPAIDVLLWGGQAETGGVATDVIPTTNATLARAVVKPKFVLPSWPATANTACIGANVSGYLGTASAWSASLGNGGNYLANYISGVSSNRGQATEAGAVTRDANLGGVWPASARVSVEQSGTTLTGYVNGTPASTTAGSASSWTPNEIDVGNWTGSGAFGTNGTISNVIADPSLTRCR